MQKKLSGLKVIKRKPFRGHSIVFVLVFAIPLKKHAVFIKRLWKK